jgi:hypothetical protein
MADDDKDDKDSGEHTQFAPMRPPTLGQPPKKEEPKPAAPAEEDRTQAGGIVPPPLGKRPAPPPPAAAPPPPPPPAQDDASDHTIADVRPPARQAPPPPPPPPPSGGGDEDEGATIVMAPSKRAGCSLQRVEPPGHGDVIKLERDDYLLGRSRTCDIPLYSTTASREHARLTKRGDAWYVRPEAGKTVIAGGSTVSGETRLVHKMRLQFGGDEMLFFDERAATAPTSARPPAAVAEGEAKSGSKVGLIVGIAAAVAVVAAVVVYVLFIQS